MCSTVHKDRPRTDRCTEIDALSQLICSLWAMRAKCSQIILWGQQKHHDSDKPLLAPNYSLLAGTNPSSSILASVHQSALRPAVPNRHRVHTIWWTVFSMTAIAFNVGRKTKRPLPTFLKRDKSRFQKANSIFKAEEWGTRVGRTRAPRVFNSWGPANEAFPLWH